MRKETKLIETIRKGYTEELWYDWFCKNSALENRGKKLFKKMKEIAFSSKINLENNYVFFKNNAKLSGKTYDDFRICSIESEEVLYTVVPKNVDNLSEVYGKENGFEKPLVIGTWKDILKFFDKVEGDMK